MYFSLGRDDWNGGSNPGLDKRAPEGTWLSGLNYCDWGTEISGANGSYNQLVCDQFGNVLNLNLQSNSMRGALPPLPTSLGLIRPLQTFDVESNNMDGKLFKPKYNGPDSLTELVNFRASLNNFRGNIPTGTIPKNNSLSGTISDRVGDLSKLATF